MPRKKEKVKIDKEQFEKLCSIQCTLDEITGWFNCRRQDVEEFCRKEYDGATFSTVFAQKRGVGRISLRRSQFRMAETNPTMSIWLGKQYLGQRDKQDVAISRNDDETIKEMEKYFNDKQGADS